jgi:hypothetical protein
MVCAFEWSSPNILRPATLPSQHYNNNLFLKKYDWFLYYNNYITFASKSVFQALNIITILNIEDRTQRGDRGGALSSAEPYEFLVKLRNITWETNYVIVSQIAHH